MSLAPGATVAYIRRMSDRPRSRSELLAILHAHEAELRARGVEALTVFGSFARDEGWRLCAAACPNSLDATSIS